MSADFRGFSWLSLRLNIFLHYSFRQAENDSLKALKMPTEDTKENQSQEEVQTLKKQMEALNDKIKGQEQANNQSSKKWYQFWK